MQKAIRPHESSWTKTIHSNIIFLPNNEDKTSSSSSLSWLTSSSSSSQRQSSLSTKTSSNLLVMENAVVVLAKRGCCMGHVAKRLLLTHGVNPSIVEVDEDNNEDKIISDLGINKEKLPVMFIGGKLFGGLENLMAAHINGDLVPILRQAKALWL